MESTVARFAELEAKRARKLQQVRDSEAETVKLSTEAHVYQELLQSQTSTAEALTQQNRVLAQQVYELRSKNEQLTGTLSGNANTYESLQNRVLELSALNSDLSDQLGRSHAEIMSLREFNEAAESRLPVIEELQTENLRLESLLAESLNCGREVGSRLGESETEILSLRKLQEECESRIKFIEEDNGRLQALLEESRLYGEKMKGGLESKNLDIISELNKFKLNYFNLENEFSNFREFSNSTISKLNDKNSKIQNISIQTKSEYSRAHNENCRIIKNQRSSINELSDAVAEAYAMSINKEKQIEQLMVEIKALKDELNGRQEESGQRSVEVDRLRGALEELQGKFDHMVEQLNFKNCEIINLNENISKLNLQNSENSQIIENYKKSITEMSHAVAESTGVTIAREEKIRKLSETIKTLTEDVARREEDAGRRNSEVERLKAVLVELQEKLDIVIEELNTKTGKIKEIENLNSKLNSKLTEINPIIKRIQGDFEDGKREYTSRLNEIQNLRSGLSRGDDVKKLEIELHEARMKLVAAKTDNIGLMMKITSKFSDNNPPVLRSSENIPPAHPSPAKKKVRTDVEVCRQQ